MPNPRILITVLLIPIAFGAIACLSPSPSTTKHSSSSRAGVVARRHSPTQSPSSTTSVAPSPPSSTSSTAPPAVTPATTAATAPSAVTAPPVTTVPASSSESTSDGVPASVLAEWTRVADCEEGGWIGYAGAAYPDSLGIDAANWDAYGGDTDESPANQIRVARDIEAAAGTPGFVPDQSGCAAW